MSEIIVITPDQLRKIINKCLNKKQTEPTPAPPQEKPQYLYSIKQLADFLHVCLPTAQKIKNSGAIRYVQTGRKLIFNTMQIMEDLAKKKGANNG